MKDVVKDFFERLAEIMVTDAASIFLWGEEEIPECLLDNLEEN